MRAAASDTLRRHCTSHAASFLSPPSCARRALHPHPFWLHARRPRLGFSQVPPAPIPRFPPGPLLYLVVPKPLNSLPLRRQRSSPRAPAGRPTLRFEPRGGCALCSGTPPKTPPLLAGCANSLCRLPLADESALQGLHVQPAPAILQAQLGVIELGLPSPTRQNSQQRASLRCRGGRLLPLPFALASGGCAAVWRRAPPPTFQVLACAKPAAGIEAISLCPTYPWPCSPLARPGTACGHWPATAICHPCSRLCHQDPVSWTLSTH